MPSSDNRRQGSDAALPIWVKRGAAGLVADSTPPRTRRRTPRKVPAVARFFFINRAVEC